MTSHGTMATTIAKPPLKLPIKFIEEATSAVNCINSSTSSFPPHNIAFT